MPERLGTAGVNGFEKLPGKWLCCSSPTVLLLFCGWMLTARKVVSGGGGTIMGAGDAVSRWRQSWGSSPG